MSGGTAPTDEERRLRDRVAGSWELVHWRIEYPATGRVTEPFGPDARGLIVLAADGWMSVVIGRATRPSLSLDVAQVTDAQRAAAFASYMHYAGRWRIDAGDLLFEVGHALHPALRGTVQRRRVELDGDALRLSGEETAPDTGEQRRHRVDWRRAR